MISDSVKLTVNLVLLFNTGHGIIPLEAINRSCTSMHLMIVIVTCFIFHLLSLEFDESHGTRKATGLVSSACGFLVHKNKGHPLGCPFLKYTPLSALLISVTYSTLAIMPCASAHPHSRPRQSLPSSGSVSALILSADQNCRQLPNQLPARSERSGTN